jgi:hypothetical protein
MPGKKHIRNSTAEFLIFSAQSSGDGLEVRYEDETIWLTQKLMARLFDVTVPTINEHLKNVFADREIDWEGTLRGPLSPPCGSGLFLIPRKDREPLARPTTPAIFSKVTGSCSVDDCSGAS